jgi:hypothetical protein
MALPTQPKFGEYAKLQFDFILMTHIDALNKQILRLPHEYYEEKVNSMLGCKYSDIITSYADGVEHLEGLMGPYLSDEYKKEMTTKRPTTNSRDLFDYAKKKFTNIIILCDKKGLLLQKIATKVSFLGDEPDEVNVVQDTPPPPA